MRVVSLVPSVTETLLAWGITPVAVTRFCLAPGVPRVGGTKDPDLAAITALAPDVVVMDDEENRRPDADALAAAALRLHVTHVRTVADVGPALAALAAAVDVAVAPAAVDVAPVAVRLLDSDPGPMRGRAFVPIWRRPWMTIGADTYGASVLAALGVATAYADSPERYPVTTLEDAAARHPDWVLAPTEPYPFAERHLPELAQVAPRALLVDGQDLFWWGVRTPGALARLDAALSAA